MWQWVHCNLFPAFQKSCCFFFGVFHEKLIAIRIGCIIYKHKKHVLSLCRTFLLRNATKPPTNLFFFKHTQVWGSNLHRKVCNKLPINLASYIVHQQSSENHKSHIILETKIPTEVYFIRMTSQNDLSRNYSYCDFSNCLCHPSWVQMIFSTFFVKRKLFFLYWVIWKCSCPTALLEYLLADTTFAVEKQLTQNPIP